MKEWKSALKSIAGDGTMIITAAEFQKVEAVVEAARSIRHWHDREPDGMIVSAEHVRKLWAALRDLDANVPDQATASAKLS